MSPSENCIVIKGLLALVLCLSGSVALAGQVIGTITDLSGPLLATKADGKAKILSLQSGVELGDTLESAKGTYARIRFIDDSSITLKPNTLLKVEKFSLDETRPDQDSIVFSLLKGGVRLVASSPGKRGKGQIVLNAPTTSIRTDGGTFEAEYVPDALPVDPVAWAEGEPALVKLEPLADVPSLPGRKLQPMLLAQNTLSIFDTVSDVPPDYFSEYALPSLLLAQNTTSTPGTGGLAAGLYVHVIDGIINLSNKGSTQSFSAGQFGYTASNIKAPVVVPSNPGIQFNPPPAFSSNSNLNQTSSSGNKPKTVDCEVR